MKQSNQRPIWEQQFRGGPVQVGSSTSPTTFMTPTAPTGSGRSSVHQLGRRIGRLIDKIWSEEYRSF